MRLCGSRNITVVYGQKHDGIGDVCRLPHQGTCGITAQGLSRQPRRGGRKDEKLIPDEIPQERAEIDHRIWRADGETLPELDRGAPR